MSEAILRTSDLVKTYPSGEGRIGVLGGVDLELRAGECVAVLGASGSGKTTLLQILGTLRAPDSGRIELLGRDLAGCTEAARTLLRRRHLGFLYQHHHLIGELSALENVAAPLRFAGASRSEAEARAGDVLAGVGLRGRLSHRPAALSGGERSRVALARALVHRPECLLLDEPTGSLDAASGRAVRELLLDQVRISGAACLLVTHDADLARSADRVLNLENGVLNPLKPQPEQGRPV